MNYDRGADVLLVAHLADLNNDMDKFSTGILADSLTPHEQIQFAIRLVRVAEMLKVRSGWEPPPMVEGTVVDEATDDQAATGIDAAAPNAEPDNDGRP